MRRSLALLAGGLLALAFATPALAQAPLTGETFVSFGQQPSAVACSGGNSGTLTYTASGTATGPYPGTFTESGSVSLASGSVTAFSATFTITDPLNMFTVTGSKQLGSGSGSGSCSGNFGNFFLTGAYEATIQTATGCVVHDQGSTNVSGTRGPFGPPGFGQFFFFFVEQFTSLTPPEPCLPTTEDECKDGGWETFGVFKNQGDCVSFVATGGKNQPAGP